MSENTRKKKVLIPIDGENHVLLSNSEMKYVKTTEDKLHLAFNEAVRENKIFNRIFSCLTILLAFLIPCLTTSFNDLSFVSGDVLKGIFWGVIIVIGLMLIYNIFSAIKNRKNYSFDNFIKKVADKIQVINNDADSFISNN